MGDLRRPTRSFSVKLAHRKPVAFDKAEHPLSISHGGRVGNRRDDPVDRNVLLERAVGVESLEAPTVERARELLEEPSRDTVLQWKEDGLLVVEQRELVGYLGDLLGLERQNYQVLGPQ